MAIVTISRDKRWVVADLFDSFHGAQAAASALKAKNIAEESIFQFVELTGNDDLEARASMFKDLGFGVSQIEFWDQSLGEGKILICVDALDEESCPKIEKILQQAGSLDCEKTVDEKKPAKVKKSTSKRAKIATTRKSRVPVEPKSSNFPAET